VSAPAPSPAVPRVAAGERGATSIADRVIARIASQAAREALRELPRADLVPRGRLPQAVVSVRQPDPRVGRRGSAMIRLLVELGYPADLRAVSAAVRRHVADRVGALADMDVREVTVEVERLHSAAMSPDRGRVT
jgi:uncharacterized alkaline shock family protein YloU